MYSSKEEQIGCFHSYCGLTFRMYISVFLRDALTLSCPLLATLCVPTGLSYLGEDSREYILLSAAGSFI